MFSICIATYNGEKYIRSQLLSILSQITDDDEIIVCDDNSTDSTVKEILKLSDSRIKVQINPVRLGHVRNFEAAMLLSKHKYLLLSDQDDIWLEGRVDMLKKKAEEDNHTLLIASNFDIINESGTLIGYFRDLLPVSGSVFRQIFLILTGKSLYFGCTFFMRREFLEMALPIPKCIESHDIWFALIASSVKSVKNMMEPTIQHRVHANNLTPKKRRSILKIAQSRLCFIVVLSIRLFRIRCLD